MKVCAKCKESKELSEFSKNRSKKDGLSSYCKICDNKRTKDYQDRNKEEVLRKHRERYQRKKIENPKYLKQKYLKELENVGKRFMYYKKNAKSRNLEFELSQDQFENITSRMCFYCNEFSQGRDFCGVDRIDSNEGYVLENCIPCCKFCNYAKRINSQEFFLKKTKLIYEQHWC